MVELCLKHARSVGVSGPAASNWRSTFDLRKCELSASGSFWFFFFEVWYSDEEVLITEEEGGGKPQRVWVASKTQRDDVDSFVCAVCIWVHVDKVLDPFLFLTLQHIISAWWQRSPAFRMLCVCVRTWVAQLCLIQYQWFNLWKIWRLEIIFFFTLEIESSPWNWIALTLRKKVFWNWIIIDNQYILGDQGQTLSHNKEPKAEIYLTIEKNYLL